MSVGQRIKSRRNELNITMTQLASMTGLTAGFISQVENEKVSVSLDSLTKIAQALEVSPINLMGNSGFKPELIRKDARPAMTFPNQVNMEVLSIPFGRDLQIVKAELPDGYQAGNQTHTHEGEEWLWVLAGEVRVAQGNFEAILSEGDSIHWDGSQPHLCQNISGASATVLIAVTPPAHIPLIKSE
jgi:transcriptional regulator with XRE-family HTH domain